MSEGSGAVGLTWIGQAGYAIEAPSGELCLLDPYLSEFALVELGLPRVAPIPLDPAATRAFVVAITHTHHDHLDLITCAALAEANPEVVFVGPSSIVARLVGRGVSPSQIVTVEREETVVGRPVHLPRPLRQTRGQRVADRGRARLRRRGRRHADPPQRRHRVRHALPRRRRARAVRRRHLRHQRQRRQHARAGGGADGLAAGSRCRDSLPLRHVGAGGVRQRPRPRRQSRRSTRSCSPTHVRSSAGPPCGCWSWASDSTCARRRSRSPDEGADRPDDEPQPRPPRQHGRPQRLPGPARGQARAQRLLGSRRRRPARGDRRRLAGGRRAAGRGAPGRAARGQPRAGPQRAARAGGRGPRADAGPTAARSSSASRRPTWRTSSASGWSWSRPRCGAASRRRPTRRRSAPPTSWCSTRAPRRSAWSTTTSTSTAR